MSCTTDSCTKNLAMLAAPDVLSFLRKLGTKNDPRHTSSEVPDLRTVAQEHEFCEVYDEVLRHYQVLAAGDTDEMTRQAEGVSVNWFNRMFATEPLVSMQDRAIMFDFYFQEENFVTEDTVRRDHFLALVAYNVNYLVLAAMGQHKRVLGMRK